MKTKLMAGLLMAALAGGLTGCVSTVDGNSKAGMPLFKDKAEGRYQRTVAQVVDAARKVVAANGGTLTSDNSVNNSLVARVNQSTVYVSVVAEDESKPVTHVTVQARLKGVADPGLAHELEKQIALQLAQ